MWTNASFFFPPADLTHDVWNQSIWALLWMVRLSKSITTVRLLGEIAVVIVVFLSPDFKCMRVHVKMYIAASVFFLNIFSGAFYYRALALLTSSHLDNTWFRLFSITSKWHCWSTVVFFWCNCSRVLKMAGFMSKWVALMTHPEKSFPSQSVSYSLLMSHFWLYPACWIPRLSSI